MTKNRLPKGIAGIARRLAESRKITLEGSKPDIDTGLANLPPDIRSDDPCVQRDTSVSVKIVEAVAIRAENDFVAKYEAAQKDSTNHNHETRKIAWLSFWAIVVYAAITAYQARLARKANTFAELSLNTAIGNFHRDERAWAKFDGEWAPLNTESLGGIGGRIQDVGKSPIESVNAVGVVEIVKASQAPSFTFKKKTDTTANGIFFPSQISPFPIYLRDQATREPRHLTAEEVDDLKFGRSYIAAYGLIYCVDQFGGHWYRFCGWREYFGEGIYQAQTCVAYNKVGEGQPPNDWFIP